MTLPSFNFLHELYHNEFLPAKLIVIVSFMNPFSMAMKCILDSSDIASILLSYFTVVLYIGIMEVKDFLP